MSERLGEERYNKQGCLMKIVEYNGWDNVIVEFLDYHKIRIRTQYSNFLRGEVKNPYHPSVFGVGIVGIKYPISINSKCVKEYIAWKSVLSRCYDNKYKESQPSYKNVTCCEEWLNYENFYEWLHEQPNFDRWLNGRRWCVDKDILIKRNRIYSPETCCLVPENVNNLFVKKDRSRGDYPIGVTKNGNKFQASCANPFTNKTESLGKYSTSEQAFFAYKNRKEEIIKQIAVIEHNKGNITKDCYETMMKYTVEIND